MFHLFPAGKKKSNQTVYVASGQVVCGQKGETLVSTPLGSCIALMAYDPYRQVGGMAHIMLPGQPPPKEQSGKNKYARQAIESLLSKIYTLGATENQTAICVVGGANVLRKPNDIIAIPLILNVLEIIKQRRLSLVAASLGGYERRTAGLQLSTGNVWYTVGESGMKTLWQFTLTSKEKHSTVNQPVKNIIY